MMMESPKKAGVAELKLPTVSELATSVAEANAALSYQLKRIANLEAELRTSNAERDAATGARSQEFLLMQTSISDLEMQLVQLDRERDAARVELERVNSHRTRTEEAALAAGEAALAIKAEQQRAAAERETALAQVARERELAQQMVEASKLEVDAVKRAAQAEKAAALEAAAAKSVLDLEDARRRVASEKQVAFEEASAELMAAVGNLLQQAGERGAAPAGAPGATRTLGELRSGFAPSLRSGRGGTSVSSADGPRSDVTDDESDEDAAINPDRIPERGMARPPAAAPITEAKVKARVARARRSRSRVETEAAAAAAAEHLSRTEAEAKLRAECEHYQRLALTAEGRAKTAEAKAAKAEARLASVEAAEAATAEATAATAAAGEARALAEVNEAKAAATAAEERAAAADAAAVDSLAEAAALREKLKAAEGELKKSKEQLTRFKNARGETEESKGGSMFAKQMRKRMMDEAAEELTQQYEAKAKELEASTAASLRAVALECAQAQAAAADATSRLAAAEARADEAMAHADEAEARASAAEAVSLRSGKEGAKEGKERSSSREVRERAPSKDAVRDEATLEMDAWKGMQVEPPTSAPATSTEVQEALESKSAMPFSTIECSVLRIQDRPAPGGAAPPSDGGDSDAEPKAGGPAVPTNEQATPPDVAAPAPTAAPPGRAASTSSRRSRTSSFGLLRRKSSQGSRASRSWFSPFSRRRSESR